jgi:iron complex outermembrane receptor protein
MLLILLWLAIAAQGQTVRGTVYDSSGAPVAQASVLISQPLLPDVAMETDALGRFTAVLAPSAFTVSVSAAGFRSVTITGDAADALTHPLEIRLLAGIDESVTVTAGRLEQQLTTVAGAVSVVDRADIERSSALTIDELLRQVPAFSLFRRSSSIAAHPTAQGVSLRGIGPSGVSRTLVLLDGVPFNDPFGGWVSWTRVPRASVDRIEVVEGSAANLFGNFAMGGAINILTRMPAAPWVEATLQYGERGTPLLEGSAAFRRGAWSGIADGGRFATGGYPVVVEEERGAVDGNVSAAAGRLFASAEYVASPRTTVRGRVDIFDESRDNGKRSTIDGRREENDTSWLAARAGIRSVLAGHELRADVFGDRVHFRSNFLAVPAASPARSLGRMTLEQFVPSFSTGIAAQWTRPAGRSLLTGGIDWRRVEGESHEDVLDPQTGTRTILHRRSGGTQHHLGAFVQAIVTPVAPVVLTIALRHDWWKNVDGHHLEVDPGGQPTLNHQPSLPDSTGQMTTPRVSALVRLNDHASLWASAGWGFRAPTLNELYRQFRVGLVTTLANPGLDAERLTSVDAGLRLTPGASTVVRAGWFDHDLRDAVSNVTLSSSASATIQQRQNLGLTNGRGVQLDASWQPSVRFSVTAAYIYNQSIVREFTPNPALVGKWLPQVPRHRSSLQVFAAHPRFAEVSIAIQAAGRQYDDDLNVRGVPGRQDAGLPGFATMDLLVSKSITRNVSLFAGAQNLFDTQVFAGTLPTTAGAPRLASVGLRWRSPVSSR